MKPRKMLCKDDGMVKEKEDGNNVHALDCNDDILHIFYERGRGVGILDPIALIHGPWRGEGRGELYRQHLVRLAKAIVNLGAYSG